MLFAVTLQREYPVNVVTFWNTILQNWNFSGGIYSFKYYEEDAKKHFEKVRETWLSALLTFGFNWVVTFWLNMPDTWISTASLFHSLTCHPWCISMVILSGTSDFKAQAIYCEFVWLKSHKSISWYLYKTCVLMCLSAAPLPSGSPPPMTTPSVCGGGYQCSDGTCINQTQVCDFRSDCSDRRDELNCGKSGWTKQESLAGRF